MAEPAAYSRHSPEFDVMRFMRDEYWRLANERRLERTSRESREHLISMCPSAGHGWPQRPRLVRMRGGQCV